MHPLITLTTDFGLEDSYVGVVKGVILRLCPDACMVDLTHDVPPGDVAAAAYHLAVAVPFFPPGTVHLAVVDPGVGTARRPVAVRTLRGIFVAPDNGTLTHVLDRNSPEECVVLDRPETWLVGVSNTFHGRDIFAPCAARLAAGAPLRALGSPASDLQRLAMPAPSRDGNRIRGAIQHIDHFGNCITNIPGDWLPADSRVALEVSEHVIHGLARCYADGPDNGLMALTGSSGFVEIAVKNGNAARRCNLLRGMDVRVIGP